MPRNGAPVLLKGDQVVVFPLQRRAGGQARGGPDAPRCQAGGLQPTDPGQRPRLKAPFRGGDGDPSASWQRFKARPRQEEETGLSPAEAPVMAACVPLLDPNRAAEPEPEPEPQPRSGSPARSAARGERCSRARGAASPAPAAGTAARASASREGASGPL